MAKFDWTEEKAVHWSSLINTLPMIGGGIGALTSGPMISIGRRRAGMLTQLIAIAGAGICMIERPDCFAIGRLLIGITAGHTNTVMGVSIAETIPDSVIWQFGILLRDFQTHHHQSPTNFVKNGQNLGNSF